MSVAMTIRHTRRVNVVAPTCILGEDHVAQEPDIVDLRSLRKERGWTQEVLAEKAGLSCRTIQRIEQSGHGNLASYRALAKTLGIAEHVVFQQQVPRPLISPRWAVRIGLAAALPAFLFVLTNLIRYSLGVESFPNIFAPLFRVDWIDSVSPIIFFGGAFVAFILNFGASVGIDLDIQESAVVPRRIAFFMNSACIGIVVITLALLAIMLGYVALETLSHWISGRV